MQLQKRSFFLRLNFPGGAPRARERSSFLQLLFAACSCHNRSCHNRSCHNRSLFAAYIRAYAPVAAVAVQAVAGSVVQAEAAVECPTLYVVRSM